MAEWNRQNREKLKAQKSRFMLSQYCGIGAIVVIGIISYYVYQYRNVTLVSKEENAANVTSSHKFEMK